MNHEHTNWGKSVAGVVIRDGKVLLARHTYGPGTDKLIIPGGYLEEGETPEDALKREFLEETGVSVSPRGILGIRFNMHDWYIIFAADYLSGEAVSDHLENSEVVWLDAREALSREDVPDLTKKAIESALSPAAPMLPCPYSGSTRHAPLSFYRIEHDT